MAVIKLVNQIEIHQTEQERYWKGKELIKVYKYSCKPRWKKISLFETMNFQEALDYCTQYKHEIKEIINTEKGNDNIEDSVTVPRDFLRDLNSLCQENITPLLKANFLRFSSRVETPKEVQDLLMTLEKLSKGKVDK